MRNVHQQLDIKYYLSFSKDAINDMSLFGSSSGCVPFRFSIRGNFALVCDGTSFCALAHLYQERQG